MGLQSKGMGFVDRALLAALGLLILITAGVVFGLYLPQKGIHLLRGQQGYTIGPRCGILPNGQLDDLIPDEDSCRNLCRANCESYSLGYVSSSLREAEGGCNACDCRCR
ncbi:hypothetical protein J4439_01930 [Candidatus Woesearchaeota archaeon]|nr:hypothetical protein [Candidatus Woesearchaeota archaeon]